jgi:hypothetical protein
MGRDVIGKAVQGIRARCPRVANEATARPMQRLPRRVRSREPGASQAPGRSEGGSSGVSSSVAPPAKDGPLPPKDPSPPKISSTPAREASTVPKDASAQLPVATDSSPSPATQVQPLR